MILATSVMPTFASAQASQDELRQVIWSTLLSDPRSAHIPPEQMRELVERLVVQAQANNISPSDILWKPSEDSLEFSSVTASPQSCKAGIKGFACIFNKEFGFDGENHFIPISLLVTSGLLIIIFWEVILHHRSKTVATKPVSLPWENMPK